MASLIAIIANGPASGAPADIWTSQNAAPAIATDPPKAKELNDGDASVSTQTGNLTYSYPIKVPPGRGKAQPQLALTYSSSAPLYGGVAAGWSLSGVPGVYQDTSDGRITTHHPLWQGPDPESLHRFTSTLVGGRPLQLTDEPKGSTVRNTYRAKFDGTYTRFERMVAHESFRWRARTSDGMTYEFGGTSAVCPGIVSEGYAPLTRTIDPFGNTVQYNYQLANGECRLSLIQYGANASAGLANFAEVSFHYLPPTLCGTVPVGSQTDWRTGTQIVTGTSQLVSITASAITPGSGQIVHTRTITLAYNSLTELCGANHSPVRTLMAISEIASGIDSDIVTLPSVNFTYGSPSVVLSDQEQGASLGLQALSWGKRFPGDIWPTLEETLVDLDGDGLLDRMTAQTTGGTCQALWHRNQGLGSNGIPTWSYMAAIDLPRLPWQNAAFPGFGTPNSVNESCSLNGQRTQYRNIFGSPQPESYLAYRWLDINNDGLTDLVAGIYHSPLFYDLDKPMEPFGEPLGPWPDCVDLPNTCSDLSSTCMGNCGGEEAFSWTCAASCIAAATSVPCVDHMAPPPAGQPEWALFAGQMQRPARKAYQRCGDRYPWFIYFNLGNGVISTSPVIKYNPKPLDSETANAAITGNQIVNTQDANADFDGDGLADIIITNKTPTPATLPFYWTVWRGDGTGAFGPLEYQVRTRPDASLHRTAEVITDPVAEEKRIEAIEGVLDLNGDGLFDHWKRSGTTTAIRPNDGLGFHWNTEYSFTSPMRLGSMAWLEPTAWESSMVIQGKRWTRDRMVDVDADGRPDVLNAQGTDPTPAQPPSAASVFLNTGGNFVQIASGGYPNTTSLSEIRGRVTATGTISAGLYWYHDQDFLDLDGDGISEFVQIAGGTMTRTRHVIGDAPPRLMRTIDNGRGAVTTVTYETMHGDAVTQGPEQPDHRATPRNGWVVQRLSTHDQISNTTTATTYQYKHPRYLDDDEGRFAFRGFDEVTTTAQSGAKTVQRYSYYPDWSGRLAETLVISAEAPAHVHSIEKTTWETFTTFVGSWIQAFHPTRTESFTCATGQNEVACLSSPAGYTRTTSTWSPIADQSSPGVGRLFAVTETLLQAGTVDATGDRKTTTTYFLVSDANNYRLVTTEAARSYRDFGGFVLFGLTTREWDPTFRVAEYETVFFEDNGNCNETTETCAITRRHYDMTTGNLLKVWKPKQWAAIPNLANPYATSYVYDSRKLFVASETNELGHLREHLYEYGTGTRLETKGPNACPSSCGASNKEIHRIRVDGLGRMIERYETHGDYQYQLRKVETNVYVDSLSPFTPGGPSITHKSAIDVNPSTQVIRYTEDKTELDGHGRPIRVTVPAQGAAAADQVTTYLYNNNGTLSEVRVPDPTANNTSTVSYTYTFDSLGRPLTIRRPDSNQTGVNLSYDGLTVTSTEVLGGGPGQAAKTKTWKDSFGRLVRVDELITSTPTEQWATTEYAYAPDDTISKISDPDGVTTDLKHDFAGRRTEVTRNTRVWSYRYDRNGNVESETLPCTGAACNFAETTTVYDDLDRPTSKLIGTGAWSEADKALFGTQEAFTWDAGNGWHTKGRLTKWRSLKPTGAVITTVNLYYDAQGRESERTQNTSAAGYNLWRTYAQHFDLAGNVAQSDFRDVDGSEYNACDGETWATYSYDNRGMLSKVRLKPCGSWWGYATPHYSEIHNARNVAGLVTKRYSVQGYEAITYAESNWTYDKLGRLTRQDIQKGNPLVQVARQDLEYFGNDDPQWMKHWLGSSNLKQFHFGYDARHQLKTATESQLPNAFTATYDYRPSGRFDIATEAAASLPNSDVKPRNVTYEYSSTDPERLERLEKVPGPGNLAEYTYDESGNQVSRYYPDTLQRWEYIYDGKNQLRRVTKKVNNVVEGSEEYWYNHTGARYLVVKRNASGTKTGAIWFIGDTEAHYDASGNLTRTLAHISMGTPVARVERSPNGSWVTEYQFHGLGNNTLATVDQASGSINTSFVYAPFGEIIEATDGGGASGLTSHPRRMNDKFIDAVSGLAYYGFRYYDKLAMSWTQGDPLYLPAPDLAMMSSPRRANLYQFSLNNPLRYLDPDGRDVGRLFAESRSGSVAAVGAQIEGGGWGPFPSEGMTLKEWRWDWGRRNLHSGGQLGVELAERDGKFQSNGPRIVAHIQTVIAGFKDLPPEAQELAREMTRMRPTVEALFGAVATAAICWVACPLLGEWLLPTAAAAPATVGLRQQYVDAVKALAGKVASMRQASMPVEQIARVIHAERRALGVQFKAFTPVGKLTEIYARNVSKYGDKLGPSIEWLREKGKSWEDIIESASRTGGKDLGL